MKKNVLCRLILCIFLFFSFTKFTYAENIPNKGNNYIIKRAEPVYFGYRRQGISWFIRFLFAKIRMLFTYKNIKGLFEKTKEFLVSENFKYFFRLFINFINNVVMAGYVFRPYVETFDNIILIKASREISNRNTAKSSDKNSNESNKSNESAKSDKSEESDSDGIDCKLLLSKKELYFYFENNLTDLMCAAIIGDMKMVSKFFQKQLGMQDIHGKTALMYAAINSNLDVVKFLSRTKEIDILDENGDTAYDVYMKSKDKSSKIESLLMNNISSNIQNKKEYKDDYVDKYEESDRNSDDFFGNDNFHKENNNSKNRNNIKDEKGLKYS